ncbi:MAG: diphosphate--fructose-6-phosphate 1-phosphotransferase [Tissierellia bacterium]|nr:diphosphate--fructose-6-phosphate 1-phosphotransferase [Tissierellia bacterium]
MNSLIGQSGGPTSVINSTLAGAIKASIDFGAERVFGLKNGIVGLINEEFVEIDKEIFINDKIYEKLKKRPSSILGSCRYKLPEDLNDPIYSKIFNVLKGRNITNFEYIGGNDSMDTVTKLNKYMQKNNISDISIVGGPKTIDNDLFGMDHSPGFGSCVKFINTSLKTVRADCDIYPIRSVTIVEIMGRNTGWLTASSHLANIGHEKEVVNIVYTSEISISKEQIIKDIEKAFEKDSNVLIALSEGFMDSEKYFEQESRQSHDFGFNHPIISGIGQRISNYVHEVMGVKTKAIELSILQRTGIYISETDSEEAFNLGYNSMKYSFEGMSGVVAVLNRKNTESYEVEYSHVNAGEIANKEKNIPIEWLQTPETLRDNITKYALPLIRGEIIQEYLNGMPKFVKLEDFTK